MKTEVRATPNRLTEFIVLKSYDGGRHWERERGCADFASAAGVAQALRTQNPSMRFRVDVAPRSATRRRRN